MIQICRAEDGQLFQSNASLRDIERNGSLEQFLQQETGIEAGAILAYLTDGRRLTTQNIRELAGSQDQSIFVFNKYYLDYDLEEVLRDLTVEPPLQPPIEESIAATPPLRPSHLATSYLRVAHTHYDYINNLAVSLQYQAEATRIASRNLDMYVLAIVDPFESIASSSRTELSKQASLLAGLEADLEIISRVKIHTELVSAKMRKAIEAGGKHRTLGDYVSNVKMRQVAESCTQAHNILQSRFNEMEQAVLRLREGTDSVRVTVTSTKLLDDADACLRRARDNFDKISDTAASLESPNPDSDGMLHELKCLDSNLRDELKFMVDVKNAFTRQSITALRRISALNNDMVQIPPALAALQASFKKKNSFPHIQRLHKMLYAYGATVVEIVRRKEFSRFFHQRAQSILDVMAKLSSSERKRRQVYRSEIYGQLPFETEGMDVDPVPMIDFSSSLGGADGDEKYSLERADVDGLLHVLDDLEQFSRSTNDGAALSAVRECRVSLEKLILKMDSLEAGFDKIAERSLLSASRISHSRRRSYEADEQMYQEVVDQLRATQDSKAHQEAQFQEERTGLKGEIHRLQSDLREADTQITGERERTDRLERELHQVKAQLESESTARRIMEERLQERSKDMEQQRVELENALGDVTEQTRISEMLRTEMARVRLEFADVKELEERNSQKMSTLLDEQEVNLRKLEEARARGEDLEEQIRNARKESEDVKDALRKSGEEKERLLKLQASEHDRVMRDHIAEADGDRAILERQLFEMRAQKDHVDRQLKDARSELEVAHADAVGLREELQRIEHEHREARHAERILREDLKLGKLSQSDYEQQLEDSHRLVAQILDVALAFRSSHVKALATAQAISSSAHPASASRLQGQYGSASLMDSVFSPGMRQSIIGVGAQLDEPSPIDPSDPAAALEALREFDHDTFQEAISKTGSAIRKWQRQCKEYRERAKGKISFRNFAKGDLALFLPTRNSISKPWAAFNVSFPHYFLQATGHLAEQLKTREWIVARITSISERIVDRDDPSSNPYGLGDGVKYYMLEVEDWTQPSHKQRRLSRKQTNEAEPTPSLSHSTPALPPGPPEPEVEDTFQVAGGSPSHPFPSRTRASSSPTARPSSLSRLLAQAPPDVPSETQASPPRNRTPSPASSPPPASTSLLPSGSVPHHAPEQPSPRRPGSRASRLSNTSKFSVGRIPSLGGVASGSPASKAAATTALTDQPLVSSPSSAEDSPFQKVPSPPSPVGSITDMSSTLRQYVRRRTASYHNPQRHLSYHSPRTSPLAASESPENAASADEVDSKPASAFNWAPATWSLGFGRKKKAEIANLSPTLETSSAGSPMHPADSTASDLLKRF